MDLDEYLWRSKTNAVEFAEKCKLSQVSILSHKKRLKSPNLKTALKMYYASDCKIDLLKLLSTSDEEEIVKNYKPKKEKKLRENF